MARLIDTRVLIDLERRGLHHVFLQEVTAEQLSMLSSVTAAELLLGVERARSRDRERRRAEFVEAVLIAFPVRPFDLEAARAHARIAAELLASSETIRQHDLMIAATALARGYSVLTHNVRHFERVRGLAVEVPNW
jgi:predicted nucleic acid-binding protein